MSEAKTTPPFLRAVLTFVSGGGSYQNLRLKLKKGGAIFGREKGDILIADPEISATHCQIQWVKGAYHIFDMNSSNGTFVNGRKVVRQALASGDVIALGKTEMQLLLASEDEVRDISSSAYDTNAGVERTSLVDAFIEKEKENTHKRGFLLTVTYRDGKEEQYRVLQHTLHLGRGTSFCRFEDDAQVSRRHLLIKLNDNGEIFVADEGSTNGSYLNGKKMKGIYQLGPEDRIRIGACEIKIRSL